MKVRSPIRGPARVGETTGALPRMAQDPIARPGFDLSKISILRQGADPGKPLDARSRSVIARSSDADLSSLRIHAGAEVAREVDGLGAQAVTIGRDLYFGAGAYAPHSARGHELVAHGRQQLNVAIALL